MATPQHPAPSSGPLPAPQIAFCLRFTPALGKNPWKESSHQQVLRTRGTAVLHPWRGCTEGSVSVEVGSEQPSLTAMGIKLGQWVERTPALLPGREGDPAVPAGAS